MSQSQQAGAVLEDLVQDSKKNDGINSARNGHEKGLAGIKEALIGHAFRNSLGQIDHTATLRIDAIPFKPKAAHPDLILGDETLGRPSPIPGWRLATLAKVQPGRSQGRARHKPARMNAPSRAQPLALYPNSSRCESTVLSAR